MSYKRGLFEVNITYSSLFGPDLTKKYLKICILFKCHSKFILYNTFKFDFFFDVATLLLTTPEGTVWFNYFLGSRNLRSPFVHKLSAKVVKLGCSSFKQFSMNIFRNMIWLFFAAAFIYQKNMLQIAMHYFGVIWLEKILFTE